MPNIRPKHVRRWRFCFSLALYRGRDIVERTSCDLKDCRRFVTYYHKFAADGRGTGKPKLVAIIVVARKLLSTLNAIIRDEHLAPSRRLSRNTAAQLINALLLHADIPFADEPGPAGILPREIAREFG